MAYTFNRSQINGAIYHEIRTGVVGEDHGRIVERTENPSADDQLCSPQRFAGYIRRVGDDPPICVQESTVKLVNLNFVVQMEQELQANAHKGDWAKYRPDREAFRIELQHHLNKFNAALAMLDHEWITEHAADCANMFMKADELFGAAHG